MDAGPRDSNVDRDSEISSPAVPDLLRPWNINSPAKTTMDRPRPLSKPDISDRAAHPRPSKKLVAVLEFSSIS